MGKPDAKLVEAAKALNEVKDGKELLLESLGIKKLKTVAVKEDDLREAFIAAIEKIDDEKKSKKVPKSVILFYNTLIEDEDEEAEEEEADADTEEESDDDSDDDDDEEEEEEEEEEEKKPAKSKSKDKKKKASKGDDEDDEDDEDKPKSKKGEGKKKGERKPRESMQALYKQLAEEGKSEKEILKVFVKKYAEKDKDADFAKKRMDIYKKLAGK